MISSDAWSIFNNQTFGPVSDNYYKNILNTYHKLARFDEGMKEYWIPEFDDAYVNNRRFSVILSYFISLTMFFIMAIMRIQFHLGMYQLRNKIFSF